MEESKFIDKEVKSIIDFLNGKELIDKENHMGFAFKHAQKWVFLHVCPGLKILQDFLQIIISSNSTVYEHTWSGEIKIGIKLLTKILQVQKRSCILSLRKRKKQKQSC